MTLEDDRAPGTASGAGHRAATVAGPAPRWFALLFALAVATHLIGNPPGRSMALRIAAVALAVAALILVRRPASRRAWAAVASLVLLTAWLEAPVLGNHWLLAAAFAAAVLVAVVRDRPWCWLGTIVRLMFVAFYAFAAFAKLNTAFLDPAVSCAVFYANQGLAAWGLTTLPDSGAVAMLPVVAALAVELSVPVLLLVPRSRSAGVALAVLFHYVISLDIGQHFYDFTAVLLVGLMAFASDDVTGTIAAWYDRDRRRAALVAGVWAVLVALVVLPLGAPGVVAARVGVLLLWIPTGAAIVWLTVRALQRPAAVPLRPLGIAALVLLGLVVVNGASPYLGIRTATGWNMYANLVTVGERANHLVVPAGVALATPSYVEVTATDDAQLRGYVDDGWLVPERNLRHHLAGRPSATVTYVRSDGTQVSGTGAELGRRTPEVVRRLLPLRAVDRSTPARCQALWLPAL